MLLFVSRTNALCFAQAGDVDDGDDAPEDDGGDDGGQNAEEKLNEDEEKDDDDEEEKERKRHRENISTLVRVNDNAADKAEKSIDDVRQVSNILEANVLGQALEGEASGTALGAVVGQSIGLRTSRMKHRLMPRQTENEAGRTRSRSRPSSGKTSADAILNQSLRRKSCKQRVRRYNTISTSSATSGVLDGIEMSEMSRADRKHSGRGLATKNRDPAANWTYSSQCVSVRLTRRNKVRGLQNDGVRTHDWTKRDILGSIVLIFFVLGSIFVICMLSWANSESVQVVIQASLTSFCQDVVVRMVAIVITEYLLIAPLCLCACWCLHVGNIEERSASEARQRQHSAGFYIPMTLMSDEKTFAFDARARVVKIHPCGQRMGIQLGWRVVAVNGSSVHDGNECRRMVQRAHRTGDTYDLLFTDDKKRRKKMVEQNPQRNALIASLYAAEAEKASATLRSRPPVPPTLRYDELDSGSHNSFCAVVPSDIENASSADAAALIVSQPLGDLDSSDSRPTLGISGSGGNLLSASQISLANGISLSSSVAL